MSKESKQFKKESKKFLWETAGDARDFLKKQLLELNAKEILSIGFYLVLLYSFWRALGRVPAYKNINEDPPRGKSSAWFWGMQRTMMVEIFKTLHTLTSLEIPKLSAGIMPPGIGGLIPLPDPGGGEGSGIRPLEFFMHQIDLWWHVAIETEYVESEDQWYWCAVPFELRALLVLSLVSALFIGQKLGELLIQELGELVPL